MRERCDECNGALRSDTETGGKWCPVCSFNNARRKQLAAESELAALRARIAELEAQPATLTPRQCNRLCFERGFEAGREAAAGAVRKLSRINSAYEDAIRALPLPVCNPLLVCQNCRRACRRGTATSAVSKLMSQMPHNT